MGRIVKVALVAAALWFAWDWFYVKGNDLASLFPSPPQKPTPAAEGGELRREPGRGLNPFVTDPGHGAPPQRPRVPDIPGAGK